MAMVKACTGYLLCAYADADVDVGLLKKKVTTSRPRCCLESSAMTGMCVHTCCSWKRPETI